VRNATAEDVDPCVLAVLIACGAFSAHAEEGVTDTEIRIGMVNAESGPASGLGK